MQEREMKPPQWGPVADPAPWPPYPWADPIPWAWKHVPFHPGDPIPWPIKVLEQLRIDDIIALRQAELVAIQDVFTAQLKAQKALLAKQQEILGKYSK
jgi:hypothetical protein